MLLYKLIKSLEYETANPDPEAGHPTGHLADKEIVAGQVMAMPGPTAPPVLEEKDAVSGNGHLSGSGAV